MSRSRGVRTSNGTFSRSAHASVWTEQFCVLILQAAERAFVARSNLKSLSIEHCDAYPANEVLPVAAGGDVAPTASQAADVLQHLERALDDAEGLIQSRPAVRPHQDAPAGSHWKRPRPAPSASPDLDMQSPLGVPPPSMPRPSAASIDLIHCRGSLVESASRVA